MAHVSSRRLVSPHLLPFGSCRPRASTRPSSGSRGSLVWPTCRVRRMAHVVCLLRLLGITLGLLRRLSTRPREPDTWARGWLWRLTWSASPSVGGELTWRTWSTSDFFYRPARPTCRIRRMVHVENSNQQGSSGEGLVSILHVRRVARAYGSCRGWMVDTSLGWLTWLKRG